MKKKLLLISLPILCITGCNDYDGPLLTCTYSKNEVLSQDTVEYKMKYQDDNISEIVFKKSIKASNAKEKENLKTLTWIIEEENKSYAENEGFEVNVNVSKPKEYTYSYIIDTSKASDEVINPLGLYKTVSGMTEYFTNLDDVEITCTNEKGETTTY